MQSASSLEVLIESKISNIEKGIRIEDTIEIAVLRTQIGSVDDVLYAFRDLAGKQLKDGSGELMARYRNYKYKLDNLVIAFRNKTGMDLTSQLRCNS